MRGSEVYGVLQTIGAVSLHHANSVTTSCTFVEQGGMLSREFVESHGLCQTAQSSDDVDKKYGVWDCIFLDHVDIHARGGRARGANYYGPVLFEFDLQILLGLPAGTEILIAKQNPVDWREDQPNSERWFETVEELSANLHFGDFKKMLMIKTPQGLLSFPNRIANIILDDPQRQLSFGEDAYTHAVNRLNTAAAAGHINAPIVRRVCQTGCLCIQKYAARNVQYMDTFFG
jgi:hypothetical protein